MRYSILLITVLIAACAPKPFKGNAPSAEIRPYVDSFFEAWGNPAPEIMYNFIELEGKSGECVTNDRDLKIINIDPVHWERFCDFQKKALIWHELGHCVLFREHTNDGDPPSYMNPAVRTCEYIEEREAELDAEMFGL